MGSPGIAAILDTDQVGAGKLNQLFYTGPSGVLPKLTITGGSVDLSTFKVVQTEVASITITGDPILASTMIGSNLADKITGGNGADTLAGNNGADTLFGGRGNDTFLFDTNNRPNSGDIVNGGQGLADRILLNANTTFDLSLLTITDVEKLQFGPAGATAFILGSQLLGTADISQVTGGIGIDQLNITANVINLTTLALGSWTDGVDFLKIIGTAATDTLIGSTGGDTFDVADLTVSVDSVVGGIGNDIYRVDQIDLIGKRQAKAPPTGSGCCQLICWPLVRISSFWKPPMRLASSPLT